jgi:hypothetical protein
MLLNRVNRKSQINTFVKFKGPFAEKVKGGLPGADLAQFLAEKLRQKGLAVCPVGKNEIPPTINVTSGSIEYSVTVCPSIYSTDYWEIDCPRTKGLISRLFGKSEEDELGSLVNAIADILRDEEAITHIKWYRNYSERLDEYVRARSVKYLRKAATFLEKFIPCLCVLGFVIVVVGFAIQRKKGWICNTGATIFMAGTCSFFLFTGISYSYQSILRIKETFLRGSEKKLVQWLFLLFVLAFGLCFFAFGLMLLLAVFTGIWK